MFLIRFSMLTDLSCFPRVRGDVPASPNVPATPSRFSPRARGCSGADLAATFGGTVFPACAGMFPIISLTGAAHGSFPRVRGDVPDALIVLVFSPLFSPRARGCSARTLCKSTIRAVFPACAGMFPCRCQIPYRRQGFPRVRGDVPLVIFQGIIDDLFSPRARGCSG